MIPFLAALGRAGYAVLLVVRHACGALGRYVLHGPRRPPALPTGWEHDEITGLVWDPALEAEVFAEPEDPTTPALGVLTPRTMSDLRKAQMMHAYLRGSTRTAADDALDAEARRRGSYPGDPDDNWWWGE